MDEASNRIYSALSNRSLTHSTFRLYVALLAVLDGPDPEARFTRISVDGLKNLVPGVRGKKLGEGALRENLRELQETGLIEMTGAKWSKFAIQVRLPGDAAGREAREALRAGLRNLPDWLSSV